MKSGTARLHQLRRDKAIRRVDQETLRIWTEWLGMVGVFSRRIVPLIEQCVECFQNHRFVLLWGSVQHDDLFLPIDVEVTVANRHLQSLTNCSLIGDNSAASCFAFSYAFVPPSTVRFAPVI